MRHVTPCTDCQATGAIAVHTDEGTALVACPTCDGRRFNVTLDINAELGWTTTTDPEGW